MKKLKLSKYLRIYKRGNYVYYNYKDSFFKKIILKIIRIAYRLFIFFPYQIEIPFETKIGDNFNIIHPNGIIISKRAIIGSNCTIFQQVTIGNSGTKNTIENIKIGNNVLIGAGAKIIGNITIGNNVKIGANAVVTKNIPDNCTVIKYNEIINNK